MKINFTRGILLGAGLLSATTLIGTSAPAEAQPNHRRNQKIERREVKVVRKTVIRRQRTNRGPNVFPSGTSTLEGRVSNDLKNNGVLLRTNNGRTVKVTFAAGEPKQLGTGDVIRVSGRYSGDSFVARTVTIIRNR